MAFSLPVECSPYLFKVPEEMARRVSTLMKVASVRDTFETQDFISGLQQIHEEHEFGKRQLDGQTCLVAVNLANELAKTLKAPGAEFKTEDKRKQEPPPRGSNRAIKNTATLWQAKHDKSGLS